MSEKTGIIIGRCFLLLIALLYIGYGLIWKPECDIDKVYLGCRLTGTVGDWIGSLMFIGGLVWLSGIIKGTHNLSSPPASTTTNWLWAAGAAIGIILVWNL